MNACLLEVQEFPIWVMIFERLGPGSCVLVFTFAVVWKLLPALTKLLAVWRAQSEKITGAVDPVLDGVRDAVNHLERIADHVAGTGVPIRGPRGPLLRPGGVDPDSGNAGDGCGGKQE